MGLVLIVNHSPYLKRKSDPSFKLRQVPLFRRHHFLNAGLSLLLFEKSIDCWLLVWPFSD